MLLLRRERLQPEQIRPPLLHAADAIATTLLNGTPPLAAAIAEAAAPAALPDPFDHDLSPWLLRRLDLAAVIAGKLRADADQVQQLLDLETAAGKIKP
jgi:hypothetical protein